MNCFIIGLIYNLTIYDLQFIYDFAICCFRAVGVLPLGGVRGAPFFHFHRL